MADFIQDFKLETEEVVYVAAPKLASGAEGKIQEDKLTFEVIAGDVDVVDDPGTPEVSATPTTPAIPAVPPNPLMKIIRAKTTAGGYSVDFSGDADLGPGVFTLKDNVSGNIAAPQAATLGGGVSARTRTDVTPT